MRASSSATRLAPSPLADDAREEAVALLDAHQRAGQQEGRRRVAGQVEVGEGVVELEREHVALEREEEQRQLGHVHVAEHAGLLEQLV